jgi:uncharacterized protein YfcZ (UPF0381/DUF406 family)
MNDKIFEIRTIVPNKKHSIVLDRIMGTQADADNCLEFYTKKYSSYFVFIRIVSN